MIYKILNYLIDVLVWVGVAATVLYVGVFDTESILIRLSSVAALWLAGYWTIRTFRAQREFASERKKLQLQTRESEFQGERLAAFIELSHDGIIILDKDNRILKINQAVSDITGYTEAEVKYQSCAKVFRCEKYKETGLTFGLAYLSPSMPSYYEEVTILSKVGRPVDIGVRCAHAKKHPGHRGASLLLIRDLSKIHEAESMEHDFVSMTSHQLFTPLSIIRGHLSLLLEEDLGKINQKQHYFLEQTLQSTKKMVKLITELLSISRLEERKITLNFVPTKLNAIVTEIVSEMQPLAERKHLTLHYETPKQPLPTLVVDGEKISQVLQNLIDNSIKYTKAKGTITIKTELRAGDVCISVADTGIGIPKADLPKLFQRFYRSANVLPLDAKGTGLGLYIAKAIVDRHQGKIWVESQEGKGSTFFVSLPR